MAQEYALRGQLSPKADVYSFGIVVLEVIAGKCITYAPPEEGLFYLLDWVRKSAYFAFSTFKHQLQVHKINSYMIVLNS